MSRPTNLAGDSRSQSVRLIPNEAMMGPADRTASPRMVGARNEPTPTTCRVRAARSTEASGSAARERSNATRWFAQAQFASSASSSGATVSTASFAVLFGALKTFSSSSVWRIVVYSS